MVLSYTNIDLVGPLSYTTKYLGRDKKYEMYLHIGNLKEKLNSILPTERCFQVIC